jgi:hypothetical protein
MLVIYLKIPIIDGRVTTWNDIGGDLLVSGSTSFGNAMSL